MAYYTKVLQPDEKVLVVGRLHWSIYLRGVVRAGVAIAVAGGSFWLPAPTRTGSATHCLPPVSVGLFGLLLLLGAWIRRRATEIVVTDRRVIFKRGLLARHTVEMNVSKIETVDVEQGLAGRIWGYGTLMIRGTGSGFEPLVGVGSPWHPQRDCGGVEVGSRVRPK